MTRNLAIRPATLMASGGLALLLTTSGATASQTPDGCGPIPRLSVSGQGESRVAPDLAMIQLGVTTQAESAAVAMSENATRQSSVIEALAAAGIASDAIQTSGLSLNPMLDYGEGRAPVVTGYQASNMVTVRIGAIDRLGEVMDAIVSAGANEIQGVTFHREDAQASEDEARRAAVEDAAHRAGILAEAAGLSLGPVLSIRDGAEMAGPPQPMMMRADAVAASTPVSPGQVSVTAQVLVDYALTGEGAWCGAAGNTQQTP